MELATNSPHLKENAGLRLEDAEYSSEYVCKLRHWMIESGHMSFEDDLISQGFIALSITNAQLGLDFILESLPPHEDMAFESGSIRYVALNPEDQLPKRLRNETIKEEKRNQFLRELNLTPADLQEVSCLKPKTESSMSGELKELALPEPPYADFCRNSPNSLKNSHLRRLREDGYFQDFPRDVQIAAYLIAKGFWHKDQIDPGFSDMITWKRFESAAAKVNHIIRKTWPERFARVKKVKETLSKKQLEAFHTRYDIDLFPTLEESCKLLSIDRSSLNERLLNVRKKFRAEFREFHGLKRTSKKWSQASDIRDGGFSRVSLGYFRPGIWISLRTAQKKVIVESIHVKGIIRSPSEIKQIKDWSRSLVYSPELKAMTGSSKKGSCRIRKGEFFHHIEERKTVMLWEKIYNTTWYSANEVTAFAAFLSQYRVDGLTLFALRGRLRLVQERLGKFGLKTGRFARRPDNANVA